MKGDVAAESEPVTAVDSGLPIHLGPVILDVTTKQAVLVITDLPKTANKQPQRGENDAIDVLYCIY